LFKTRAGAQLLGKGHLLGLKGIDSGDSPYGGLIKLDGARMTCCPLE